MSIEDFDPIRYDRAPALSRPLRRARPGESGAVIYDGIAAVEGVQPYPEQGPGYAEYVSRAALDATAAGLVGAPVFRGQRALGRVLHPGQAEGAPVKATPDDWQDHTVGVVLSAEVIEIDGLAAVQVSVSVLDADAQRDIESGRARGLSPLYTIPPGALDPTPGTWRGQSYSAVQNGRHINNLCIVDDGRGGALCALRADAQPGENMPLSPEDIAAIAAAVVEALKASAMPEQETEIELSPDACGSAVKAKMDAMAEELAAMKAEKEKAALMGEAQKRADAAAAIGLSVTDFDVQTADRASIAKLDERILAHLVKPRADASPLGTGARYTPPTPAALPVHSTI